MKRVPEQDLPGVLSPTELNSSSRFADVTSEAYFIVGQELLYVRDPDGTIEDLPVPVTDQYRLTAGVAFAEMAVRLKGMERGYAFTEEHERRQLEEAGTQVLRGLKSPDEEPPTSH